MIGPNIIPGRELLGEDYPALAEVDDFNRIGQLMIQMAEDANLREICIESGLAIAKKFRPENTMGRLAEICRNRSL